MNESSPSHSKKPSFFRTLPENIATSPTGIIKISNSPFPSLDPTKQFRSVYERAGFDVYKPDKSRQGSRVASPIIKGNGFRSQSTSQLNQNTGGSKVFDQKRNFSEHHNIGHSNHNYGEPIPGLNKSPLTIDANLANVSQRGDLGTQISTGNSTATSTFDNPLPKPLHSATSSTFTDTDARSNSTRTSSKFNNISSSNFVSAHSLPYSAHSKRSSKGSTRDYNTSPSSSRIARESNAYHSPSQSFSRISPTKRLFEAGSNSGLPNDICNGANSDDVPFQASSDNAERSVETVRYTPQAKLEPSLTVSANNFPGAFPNNSYENVNPLSNSTDLDISQSLAVNSDNDISDDESFKSEILSPKNQHFNFENGEDTTEDSSMLDTTRGISLRLPTSPPENIPQLTVSDTDGNDFQFPTAADFPPPTDFKKSSDMRQSAVSVAASSIYSNDFRQSNTPFSNISEFDAIDEHEAEDYQYAKSSTPVYEEIEQQLESLSMKSPQPPQILIHSVKEVSTDSVNDAQNEEGAPLEIRKTLSNKANTFNNDPNETVSEQSLDVNEDSTSIIQQEPEIPKYPPGEGPCRKCDLEIERKPIYSKSGELSGQWHRECFTCTLCDLRFNKNISCFVLKDLPYCEYHYHLTNNSLCKVCGQGIVGKCLENDAQDRYHVECLKCTKCEDFITSDYLSINGKVHCESCASEFTSGSRLNDPNDVIERRRTKLYFI